MCVQRDIWPDFDPRVALAILAAVCRESGSTGIAAAYVLATF